MSSIKNPAPAYLKETGISWDLTVAALDRWYKELSSIDPLQVKDVPQPVIVVKECGKVSAIWHGGDNYAYVGMQDGSDIIPVPVPLILAMADAIRKVS